jgi:TPR repeat protein
MKFTIFLLLSSLLIGCAGPNPNIGERGVDTRFHAAKFDEAFTRVIEPAMDGKPWAQLRLGMFYEMGRGVEENLTKAEFWYKKAAAQKADGEWAEGKMFGATGKNGWFNQNSDARIAQYHLARLYLRSGKNLQKALNLIDIVIKESEGNYIFFCCEFAGGEYFYYSEFIELKSQIEEKLTP